MFKFLKNFFKDQNEKELEKLAGTDRKGLPDKKESYMKTKKLIESQNSSTEIVSSLTEYTRSHIVKQNLKKWRNSAQYDSDYGTRISKSPLEVLKGEERKYRQMMPHGMRTLPLKAHLESGLICWTISAQ